MADIRQEFGLRSVCKLCVVLRSPQFGLDPLASLDFDLQIGNHLQVYRTHTKRIFEKVFAERSFGDQARGKLYYSIQSRTGIYAPPRG